MRVVGSLIAAILVVSSCRTPATSALPTATPSATAAPSNASSSPLASASPMPTDFVLPQSCSYVGSGAVDATISTLTYWFIDCGAAPDLDAIEKLRPAFEQQGWSLCSPPMGKGVWAKGTVQTSVSQSAVGYPVLAQLPRQPQDCPLPTAYSNSLYRFSLSLPPPYRNSERLRLSSTGGRPDGQEVFTARTDPDEANVAGTGCQTACPIWDHVAVVQIYTGAASDTPRQWYMRSGGAVGETIEETTVDGPTGGQDQERRDLATSLLIFKLEQILTSFRFVP